MTAAGRWAHDWLALLTGAAPSAGRRVAQGRKLLRSGRVSDVRTGPGTLSGKVQGVRATPLAVRIDVAVLDDQAWAVIVEALAGQVRHSARLLAGQVPEGLQSQAESAGVSLFPTRDAIRASCGCADPAPVCAHIAAVSIAGQELIDADPFVLLLLRGRGRERLLAEVAAARGRGRPTVDMGGRDIGSLRTAGWHTARGHLAELELELPPEPRPAAGPLRLLGDPPGWAGSLSAGDLFGPLVAGAAAWARAVQREAEADPAAGAES